MRRGVFCRIEPVGSASAFDPSAHRRRARRRASGMHALHLRIARLEIAQEPGQRVAGGHDPRHLAELGAVGAEPAGDHVEGAAVRALGHLGRVFVAQPRGAELVLGQRIGDAGAQHVGALRVGERLEALPAVAVQQLDVLGRLLPVPRRPVDVGAEPQRLAALEAGDHLEREIVAADIGQRAGLDHQPRHADLVGEVGGAGRAQHRLRLVRLVVHQIDHRKPRRHLRARGALQAVVDLVLQQLGALVEQIDRDQPLGELADLRRDHVPAEAAQENLDPGRKNSVGRGAVCARGQSRADRHGPAPVDFTPSSPGRTKRRDPAIPFQGAKPCPMN